MDPRHPGNELIRVFEGMMHEVPKRAANPWRGYALWQKV